MKKIIKLTLVMALSIATILAFAACGSSDSGAGDGSAAASGDQIVIKIAHTDTDTRSTNVAAQEFKDFIEAETDGKVKVELYPNGQLGDDDDLFKGLKLGTCQIYIGGPAVVSGQLGEKLDIFNLPYLFDGEEAWENGMNEQGGLDLYNEQLAGTGYKCLDMEYDGTREILTTTKVAKSLGDLKGLKLRVNDTDLFLRTYKALGANPTPLSFGEVYTALSQGTVDGVDHVPGVMVDQKWQEPAKGLLLSDHIVSALVVMTSEDFYNSLPEDVKATFDEGIAAMTDKQIELEKVAEQDAIQTMKDAGVEVVTLSDDQKAEFKDAVKSVIDTYRESLGDELIDKTLDIAEKANAAQ